MFLNTTKILFAFAMVAAQFQTLAQAEVLVKFSPAGGVRNAIVSELNAAKSTVDVAMYSFSDRSIQDALVALANKHVAVRLILNDARAQKVLADRLEQAGIDVRYVLPVMHHKFAIVDALKPNASLITGSANWSTKSDQSYDEDFLTYRKEPTTIQAFQAEFDYLWEHSRDLPGVAPRINHATVSAPDQKKSVFTSANFEAFHSGSSQGEWSFRAAVDAEDGVAGKQILDAISGAKKTIKIATTHFRRNDFYTALLSAKDRGVKVEMIVDQQEFRGQPSDDNQDVYYDEQLAQQGVDVRYKVYMYRWQAPTAAQLHSKYMIVDGREVLTGSFNWTSNSEVGSFENLNILTEANLVRSYDQNFVKIFGYGGVNAFKNLVSAIVKQGGRGPCSFAPVALKEAEFSKLRSNYKADACKSN